MCNFILNGQNMSFLNTTFTTLPSSCNISDIEDFSNAKNSIRHKNISNMGQFLNNTRHLDFEKDCIFIPCAMFQQFLKII